MAENTEQPNEPEEWGVAYGLPGGPPLEKWDVKPNYAEARVAWLRLAKYIASNDGGLSDEKRAKLLAWVTEAYVELSNPGWENNPDQIVGDSVQIGIYVVYMVRRNYSVRLTMP